MVEPVSQNTSEDEPDRPEEERPTRASRRGRSGSKKFGKVNKKRSFWKELPILIVVALVLTILIQQFLAKVYMIPSGSMETTLHGCAGCTGDRILVDRITYDFTDPSPGDVVVFKGPPAWAGEIETPESSNIFVTGFRAVGSLIGFAPPDERDFVKRIIAVGGQTVQCCDNNRVVVNGKALDEPYIHWEEGMASTQKTFDPITVPAGYVYVMGDNRNNSSDSRFQGGGGVNGAVPVDNIIGKARVIVLPPGRWGGVSDHNPQANAQPLALGAPAWQQGLPLGVGIAAAWPVVFLGRRMSSGVRKAVDRRR
ncbi:signal peptidase I [Amycolatopsis sp. NPDC051071]|uniref:signal peptidase I n=1 Tax=Amycolatopsis sp. NPDC051071 TaxID=3154637 RepID=UPI00343039E0